jgi:hypothetical protein
MTARFQKRFKNPKGGIMGDDIRVMREIVLEADAETLQKMRKEGMREVSRYIVTKPSAQAVRTRRRRLWHISGFLWRFEC